MSNPVIPRDQVHELCEACATEAAAFQPTGTRLLKEQRRLSRFFEQNVEPIGNLSVTIASYMLSVAIRVFDQLGGRLKKVSGEDIERAQQKVSAQLEALMPVDAGFPERAKAVEGRAQPHLCDEVIWGLYEREDEKIDPAQDPLTDDQKAMIYLLLWTAIEALDANWVPPKDKAA